MRHGTEGTPNGLSLLGADSRRISNQFNAIKLSRNPMAASDQADDLLTKLSGISAMLHTISGTTLSLSATVMRPEHDSESIPVQNELAGRIEETLEKAVFLNQEMPVLENKEMQVETELFGTLTMNKPDWDLFVNTVTKAVIEHCSSTTIRVVRNSLQKEATSIAGMLTAEAKSIAEIRTVASKMIQQTSDTVGTTLRVMGASGVSKEEAERSWMKRRKTIMEKWAERKEQADSYQTLLRKLANMDADGETDAAKAANADVVKQGNVRLLHIAKVREVDLKSIYQAYVNDGEAVHTSKEEYQTFPLPDHVESGDYESFKDLMLDWCKHPATIKKYYLIVMDIMYLLDAVDADKAIHLLPPDARKPSKEDSLEKGYVETVPIALTEDFKAAKLAQSRTLWEELHKTSSQKMRLWASHVQSLGQFGDNLVVIEKGASLDFLYCLLSKHVKFTSVDQKHYDASVASLCDLFTPGENVHRAVEKARSRLEAAAKVGVRPSWSLGGRDVIGALAAMDPQVQSALAKAKVLDDEDVMQHEFFKAHDVTRILQVAFLAAVEKTSKKQAREDKFGAGLRKHPEAGAEVSAFDSEVKTKMTAKRDARVATALGDRHKVKSLSDAHWNAIKAHSAIVPVDADYAETKILVEAMSITLTNGQSLDTTNLDKLRSIAKNKGKGKGGGKNSKGKGSDRGKTNTGRGKKGDVTDQECAARGCREHTTLSWNGTAFKYCKKHADQEKASGKRKQAAQSEVGANITELTLALQGGEKKKVCLDHDTVAALHAVAHEGAKIAEEENSPSIGSMLGAFSGANHSLSSP